jgi:MATE family multidrug resistance protein
LTLKEHYIKNISLAYPVMLSQVGHILVVVADSMMVGHLGAVPLAAVSLASSVVSVVMLFGLGISYGMTPLVAVADGANDKRASSGILKHGLILNIVVGVVLVGMCFVAGLSFQYLDQDADVLMMAMPYFYVMSFSLLPLMIFQTFRQFTEGLSMTRQAMYISVSSNIINVLFNYVLIYGKFGFPQLGVVGAGWSTLISRVLMAVAIAIFVLKYRKLKKYLAVFSEISIEFKTIKNILKIGVPSGLQYVFEIGAFTMAAIMTGWMGAEALAAHQIALNLSAISYMTATGIAAAASIRIGNQLGRQDYLTLRQAGMTCFVMAAVLMVFFGLVFIVGKDYLPTWYINDSSVIAVAATLLVVAAIFQVSDGVQAVGLGVLRGLSDVKVPTVVTIIAYWFVAIPVGYLLGVYLSWGAVGIWIGLCVGLTVAAVAHLWRFHKLSDRLLR